MNRRLVLSSLVLLATAIVVGGCLEVNQTMTINGNSGTFEFVVAMPTDVATTVSKDSPYAIFFDTAKGAKHFTKPGMTVVNYRVYSDRKGKRRIIKVRGEITDLQKALASGTLGAFTLGPGKKGRRLECALAKAKVDGMAARKEAFNGVSLTLSITVPQKVHDTNGKASGKTVIWELGLDKLKDQTLYLEFE